MLKCLVDELKALAIENSPTYTDSENLSKSKDLGPEKITVESMISTAKNLDEKTKKHADKIKQRDYGKLNSLGIDKITLTIFESFLERTKKNTDNLFGYKVLLEGSLVMLDTSMESLNDEYSKRNNKMNEKIKVITSTLQNFNSLTETQIECIQRTNYNEIKWLLESELKYYTEKKSILATELNRIEKVLRQVTEKMNDFNELLNLPEIVLIAAGLKKQEEIADATEKGDEKSLGFIFREAEMSISNLAETIVKQIIKKMENISTPENTENYLEMQKETFVKTVSDIAGKVYDTALEDQGQKGAYSELMKMINLN